MRDKKKPPAFWGALAIPIAETHSNTHESLTLINRNMNYITIFDDTTRKRIGKSLEKHEFAELMNAIKEWDEVFPKRPEFIVPESVFEYSFEYHIPPEEIGTTLLFLLSRVRAAKQFCKKLKDEHILLITKETRNVIHRMCMSSHDYMSNYDEEYGYQDFTDPEIDLFERSIYIFILLLHLTEDIKSPKKTSSFLKATYPSLKIVSPYSFKNQEALKQCILNLYNSELKFDIAPMVAVQHLSSHREFRHQQKWFKDNAFVSWVTIIKKLEKEDNWLVIKDFLDRTIKKTIDDTFIREEVIEVLDNRVEAIRKPTPIPVNKTYNIDKVEQFVDTIQEQTIQQ